jgi:hypothetical protein
MTLRSLDEPNHAAAADRLSTFANSSYASARLVMAQRCQALRDARESVGVTEDFQGQLHALKVIYRQQDSLRGTVAGQYESGHRAHVLV